MSLLLDLLGGVLFAKLFAKLVKFLTGEAFNQPQAVVVFVTS